MDGTFGGGDLISASLAIMLGDGEESELHDKSVTLVPTDIKNSQTGIFEYDPQDESPTGTPPGPWDGYSLFTIDLSAIKSRIENLEDLLDDINDLLEADDPDYDPETDDPVQQVDKVIDEKDEAEQEAEECEQCRAEVIAKMQEYDPSFNPQDCQDMVDEVDKIAGYELPIGTDPTDPTWTPIIGNGVVTDTDGDISVSYYAKSWVTYNQGEEAVIYKTPIGNPINYQNVYWVTTKYVLEVNGVESPYMAEPNGYAGNGWHLTIDSFDKTTGTYHTTVYDGGGGSWGSYSCTDAALISYGDTSHTYRVKNS